MLQSRDFESGWSFMARIAFLGGTGPEGLGLALRFAAAGEDVIIGSRQRERAEQAAATLREKLAAAGIDATIRGYENEVACQQAEVVALTLPFEGVEALLTQVRPSLAALEGRHLSSGSGYRRFCR